MICVLCGDPVEDGEIFMELKLYRKFELRSGAEIRTPVPFENGNSSRCVHYLCPTNFGAPRELTGTDGARLDV